MATELAERILKLLQENGISDTLHVAELWKEDHQKIVGAVKSLQSLGDIIEADLQSTTQWTLTDEGKSIVEHGSHEAVVYHSVPVNEGISQSELMTKAPNAKVGFSKAMALGWILLDKTHPGGPRIFRKVDKIDDVVQQNLTNLVQQQDSLNNQLKQEYKKRKLIQEIVIKSYILKPGPTFSTSISKQETDLTPEMMMTGTWKEKQFKPYNLDALGTPIARGHLHPLLKVRAEFRQIFLEMGFTEMPTNNYVESSFWNFDALFQPQQHPARDAHDTFFLSDPAAANDIPQDFMERVKTVHSVGGYGSVGYGYEWKIEEARKNLMRTHTTAVSARMLYALAQKDFKPMKYFSIDRVFRNETLDATHLAEFHQIEGVVADYGLTLGDLIGVLYEFFHKLGIEKLRFKPAYNPYTEPSMEIFSYHPGLGKWVEVGNSGLFRPEMLLPMGLPEGVSVIAWGLSLERPTMIKYGLDNIRDLVGHKVNLQMVADNPVCRLDKHRSTTKDDHNWISLEQRIDSIINRLKNIQTKIEDLKGRSVPKCINLIIDADPRYPPYSIPVLIGLLCSQKINVHCTTHKHSTLLEPLPLHLTNWLPLTERESTRSDSKIKLKLVWIWKPVGSVPKLRSVDHSTEMQGECTIARLLARLLESSTTMQLYEKIGFKAAEVDEWIDLVEMGLDSKSALLGISKRIEQRLKNSDWLIGSGRGHRSLCDIAVAALLRDKLDNNRLKEWFTKCLSL